MNDPCADRAVGYAYELKKPAWYRMGGAWPFGALDFHQADTISNRIEIVGASAIEHSANLGIHLAVRRQHDKTARFRKARKAGEIINDPRLSDGRTE
jgi:hypothetical protein